MSDGAGLYQMKTKTCFRCGSTGNCCGNYESPEEYTLRTKVTELEADNISEMGKRDDAEVALGIAYERIAEMKADKEAMQKVVDAAEHHYGIWNDQAKKGHKMCKCAICVAVQEMMALKEDTDDEM